MDEPFEIPDAIVLSQWIEVDGYGWPSSCKARQNIWSYFVLMKIAPNYASTDDDVSILSMVYRVDKALLRRIGSFFFGNHPRNKFPYTRLFSPLAEI